VLATTAMSVSETLHGGAFTWFDGATTLLALLLAGRVRARSGHIEFSTASRATLGDDVVILGRKAATPAGTSRSPLALRLDLDFGDAFRIIGGGLDANISGRLALTSGDDGTLSARGTVSTARGTYSAFGQRLEIDRGSLIFNGPLENPGLDILALRRLPSVEAGVELTGTVRAPLVRTTSNPPMSQGDTLSWLMLGRSLDTASQGDAALIAGIAGGMLGGNGAVPITRRIADAFGLDDVGVRGSSVIDGQVFTVGKRLSNRVYVAYEQAVSAATNLLRIDFELQRFVTLRAEAGAVSSFGIFYTRTLR
jgi:translocation and assembly module TamB